MKHVAAIFLFYIQSKSINLICPNDIFKIKCDYEKIPFKITTRKWRFVVVLIYCHWLEFGQQNSGN